MIGVVYLGSNPKTEERLRYIPGRLVQYTRNYKDAASACSTHVRNEHFILFYEQGDPTDDINAITYLKKKNSESTLFCSPRNYLLMTVRDTRRQELTTLSTPTPLLPNSTRRYSSSPIARTCCSTISSQSIACCASRFPFGRESSMYSSLYLHSLSHRPSSSSRPLPFVWRARGRLSSSQSELAPTTPSSIS